MLKFFTLVTVIVGVYGADELVVTHSPPSLRFKGHDALDESILKDVYSASLGFTTQKDIDWKGVHVKNPFHYAEAVVSIVVDGLSDLHYPSDNRFPLNLNDNEQETWESLSRRITERYPEEKSVLLRADLSEGKASLAKYRNIVKNVDDDIRRFRLEHLDTNNTEDMEFLKELSLLSEFSHKAHLKAVSNDGVPDIYYFIFRSLRAVRDLYGEASPAYIEATDLLNNMIQTLTKTFVHAYKGKVLATVVSIDTGSSRKSRSLLADPEPPADQPSDKNINLTKEYDPEYPVIFNIMLWFNIAFFYSIIAVAVFIATMDPGRDSIIYRMTSNRMKKDN